MNRLLLWLTGISKALAAFVFPLLRSKVADYLADPRVQKLAVNTVILMSGYKATPDEKSIQAAKVLQAEAKEIGKEFSIGIAATIVEAAYQKLKQEAPSNIGK
jgi:hypothetical protein